MKRSAMNKCAVRSHDRGMLHVEASFCCRQPEGTQLYNRIVFMPQTVNITTQSNHDSSHHSGTQHSILAGSYRLKKFHHLRQLIWKECIHCVIMQWRLLREELFNLHTAMGCHIAAYSGCLRISKARRAIQDGGLCTWTQWCCRVPHSKMIVQSNVCPIFLVSCLKLDMHVQIS